MPCSFLCTDFRTEMLLYRGWDLKMAVICECMLSPCRLVFLCIDFKRLLAASDSRTPQINEKIGIASNDHKRPSTQQTIGAEEEGFLILVSAEWSPVAWRSNKGQRAEHKHSSLIWNNHYEQNFLPYTRDKQQMNFLLVLCGFNGNVQIASLLEGL